MALVYVRVANTIFDPIVARVVDGMRKRGAAR